MIMHDNEKCVPQNNLKAYMWLTIAQINGNEKASKLKNEPASNMTSTDISEAQKMAKECMDSNYQNCDW